MVLAPPVCNFSVVQWPFRVISGQFADGAASYVYEQMGKTSYASAILPNKKVCNWGMHSGQHPVNAGTVSPGINESAGKAKRNL